MLLYLAQDKLSSLVLRIFEGLLRLIILDALVRVDKEFPIGHGLVEGSLHFRNGSTTEVSDGHANVCSWGQSGSGFRAAGGLLVAISGLKPRYTIATAKGRIAMPVAAAVHSIYSWMVW